MKRKKKMRSKEGEKEEKIFSRGEGKVRENRKITIEKIYIFYIRSKEKREGE